MPTPGWINSDRHDTLPRDWGYRAAFAKNRALGQCEWPGYTAGRAERLPGERCLFAGSDADHIGDRHNHGLDNLQWLCGPHHQQKTINDRRTRRGSDRRPPERHPGLRGKSNATTT